MRILLTGATGFIGSHIAREILNKGFELRIPIRKNSNLARISDITENIEIINIDLFDCSNEELNNLCHSIDLCIHAAWYAVPGLYLSSFENISCVQGSVKLLHSLSNCGCKRSLFIGTCFEYDLRYGYLTEETTPLNPDNLYAASKLSTYFMGLQASKLNSMEFVWARLFYQYGPYEDKRRLVPYLINSLILGKRAILTHGLQVRDFSHVSDIASAILMVAISNITGAVNIGSGQPVTVRNIVNTITSLLGGADLIQYGVRPSNSTDPLFVCANNSLLLSTGWKPKYELEYGIQNTITWWKEELSL